ncbi:uncharacterized protein LOC108874563 isoform X2 [Lates calcarifer]|uniref:Uncharacterized protein LOC108874563 isoform X2 n=2 Tax=Lates calcarifer TaxID=8187 RepID=A0AAJ7LCV5_LATCA|nr:uncharacterized protein LOC108874563 isoform X2 [Lates calcarifer]
MILTLINGTDMDPETVAGVGNLVLSKAELLRVVVTEKLTAAAQEILAVVDRIVAGYEEEASGFRQEIDRQKRQLEVLLQPEIKVEETDDQHLFPISEPIQEEAPGGGGELPEEEQQQKYELNVEEDRMDMGLRCYTEEEMDEDEEMEESSERPEVTSTQDQDQDHLSEPDYESRLPSPRVQSDLSAGRRRSSEPQGHMDLKLCILEDSQIELLSPIVYKKYPLQELQCPRGLQEAEFLNLLKSTFPQLAADKPFSFLMADRRRKLQPLNVKTLTPEEISRAIRRSALYIQLKTPEEPQTTDEEFHSSQGEDTAAAADSPSTPDQTRSLSLRVKSDRIASRRRFHKPEKHVNLRVCIMEDSEIEVSLDRTYKKYPLQELQCPRGLQEAEFLNLLRFTFPQLETDKPFDIFTADRKRKLQPLNVKTLTPEQICRANKRSVLYIRLKTQEKPQTTDEEFHSSQKEDAAAADSPSTPDRTRLPSPRVQSERRKKQRRRKTLRVYILEDSKTEVLSTTVFRKYPLQKLPCPLGLQEAEFLNLLKSTFPQLAADKPFDLFMSDGRRKLHPLNVKTLTPEEFCRVSRRSALYIRLKTQEKPQTLDEEFHSSQKEDAAAAASPSTPDRTSPSVRLLLPRVQLDRMMADRNRVIEPRSHIDLRIHILDHSQDDVLSNAVFKKFPSEKLKCPRGLQEAEFLNLLRSTFPQLAADKPFEFLKTNRSKRLQPLNVKTVIPEEISRAIGHSSLYIRLKPFEELEKDPPQQKKDAATKKSPSTPGQTRLNTSVQPDRRKTVGPQISDVHNHVNLRIRILEDPRINVLNVEVFQKYPLQELRCPSVLKEPEFLDLLRSTFPQLADDKPFDVLITDRSRKLRPLDVKTLTPQEISRTLGSIMNNHIYFRLKSQEEAQASAEKLHLLQRKVDEESPSTSGQSRLQTRVHRKTSQDIETGSGEEDSERERSPNVWNIQSLLLSDSEKEEESGEEVVDGDDDWKPNRGVASLMNKEPEMAETSQQPKRSGVQANRLKLIRRMLTSNHDPLLSCKVCGAPRTSMNMLIKHSWSHVDDTEKLCGICGQNSDSADELRNHLQSHQKTRSCHICRKSFLTSQGLRGHIARHTGDKPHVCNVCHKAFPEKSALSIHMWTHSADKPHKCDVCQKSFLKKINLEHHRATHSAEKLYNCSVCMKTFKSHEHVSQHMLIHSSRPVRESKYTCEICSKRFYTNQKLQFHLSSHTSELRSHRHSTPRRNPPAAWPSVRASL